MKYNYTNPAESVTVCCKSNVQESHATLNQGSFSKIAIAMTMKNEPGFGTRLKTLLLTLLLVIAAQYEVSAQVLISAAQGGFEVGETFAANGWTEVQSTPNQRKWRVGATAVPYAGSNSAYVGNASNYNGANSNTQSHFYKDVTIPAVPAGQGAYFSFWLKMPTIEAGYDVIRVYRGTSASPLPVANVLPTTGYTEVYSNSTVEYANWTKIGPYNWAAFAGQTVRIVFTFDNDFMTGTPNANPAIDDIQLTVSPPLPTTQCATLTSPANAATNVAPTGTIDLQWTAPASGPVPTSYDIYCGTSTSPAFMGNVTTTTSTITGLAVGTTYYWKIVPKSPNGNDPTTCTTRSFTTANQFLPYCYNVVYSAAVEPITSVNFAGINRTSPAAVDGSPSIENFTADVANVTTANSYTMTLKGNTAGNFTTYFTVFADWNQDGDLTDAGEIYTAGSVTNSTGVDAKTAVSTIAVPEGALPGLTRMRIKKLYFVASTTPCNGGDYGQTEDYTINVTACTPTEWYADADGDGFGNAAVSLTKCLQPIGYVANRSDCDDTNNTKNSIHPFYVDADGDGHGVGNPINLCALNAATPPAGYAVNNGDCNDAVSSINPGNDEILYNGIDDNCDGQLDEDHQRTSQMIAYQCGTTLPDISSLLFFTHVPQATAYRFEITNTSTNAVQWLERPVRWFELTSLPSHDWETTYSVRAEAQVNNTWLGYYGTPCLISTPPIGGPVVPVEPPVVTGVIAEQCGIVLPTISTIIMTSNVNNATGYRFRITNLTDPTAPNQVQVLDRAIRWFSLPMLDNYFYGTTYRIEVAVKTTGGYSAFGAPCEVTTPAVPTLTNCGQTVASAGTIVSTMSRNNSTSYRFEYTDLSTGITNTIQRPMQWFRFNMLPGYTPGAQYNFRVAVMTSGAYSPYGAICTITAPGAARFDDIKGSVEPTVAFKAIAYPNPTAYAFSLDIKSSSDAVIQVMVYDMIGKLLDTRAVSPAEITTLQLGDNYPAGVYNIIVQQQDSVESIRVVKR